MAMNKRKTTTAIVAGVTALALVLGGTFAWTSIQQMAKNEAIVDINPGGRLHDDFNGANKDVYVENFGDDIYGVNIFARIRLDQYFEVGQDAGKNKTDDMENRNVEAKIGTDIDDVTTWETYIPGEDLTNPVAANPNWEWYLGNDGNNLPYYMPTFNKNKDSLAADINGTYEGTVNDDIVHYDDYVQYKEGDEIEADAIYDWDEDTDEDYDTETSDRNDPIDSADVLKETEKHPATQISTTAEVITMAQWIDRLNDEDPDNDTGDFWVYDTDGWAYWAAPIAPGETTGLLLDGISMTKVPDDNWYYGINVVGQFATAGDWEMFFTPEAENGGGTMTEDAKQLMELITEVAPSDDDETPDFLEDGILTLRSDNGDTETVNIGAELPVDFDAADIGPDDTQPDISQTITITKDVYDYDLEEWGEEPVEEDQYTYTYNEETQTGTLIIVDPDLEGASLNVKDANGVVSGDVEISSEDDGDDDTPGSGDGTQPLILVDKVDVSLEANFGSGAIFTLSCAEEINGVTVEGAMLGSYSWPNNVTYVENNDGTITVTVGVVTDAAWFGVFAEATLDGETINDSLQINLNPDLKAYGVNIYLPEGYSGGISPANGGTFTASSDNLTWSIEGSTDPQTDDNPTGTFIDTEHGVLSLSLKEEAETLTIKAVDKDDPTKGGEYKLTVIFDTILSIEVESTGNNTANLTAVDARYHVPADTYTWSVTGNATVEDGVFTATEAGEYTVTVTSMTNSKVTASIMLTVAEDGTVTYK